MPEDIAITMNEADQRFEAAVDGRVAFLTYRRKGDSLILVHTEVPEALENRGIGSKLARAGLDYAREHNLTVIPRCSFVAAYLRRHPEYHDLLDPSYRAG